jgi:hypothetical protein
MRLCFVGLKHINRAFFLCFFQCLLWLNYTPGTWFLLKKECNIDPPLCSFDKHLVIVYHVLNIGLRSEGTQLFVYCMNRHVGVIIQQDNIYFIVYLMTLSQVHLLRNFEYEVL